MSKFQEDISILKVEFTCQSDLISYYKQGFVDFNLQTTVSTEKNFILANLINVALERARKMADEGHFFQCCFIDVVAKEKRSGWMPHPRL